MGELDWRLFSAPGGALCGLLVLLFAGSPQQAWSAGCAKAWPPGGPDVHRAPACIGLAVGNDPAAFAKALAWSGGAVTAVTVFVGQRSWSDFEGGAAYEVNLWRSRPETKFWSIPLIVKGAKLSDAGAGAYNSHYAATARMLAAASPEGPIFVRTGWEFNGGWMPWSAIHDPGDFRLAYRQFVRSFRQVSDRFVFTWAANIGEVGLDPALGYPGDDVVDIIGMDFYQQPHDPAGASNAWTYMIARPHGLQWLEDFAAAHHKPSAYPEWGVRGDDAGPYIAAAGRWFAQHPVAYESYWDSNDAYRGKLSDGRRPHAGMAYVTAVHALAIH